MKIKQKIGAGLGALAMIGSAGVVVAAPAAAGTCEQIGSIRVCGKIENQARSPRTLPVTCNLGSGMEGGTGSVWQTNHDSPFKDYRETQPGQRANCEDADGYHVPWGYYAYQSDRNYNYENPNTIRVEYNISPNHWKKVNSAQDVIVSLYKYPSGQGPAPCCRD